MRKALMLMAVLVMTLLVPGLAYAAVPQPGDPNVRVAKFWIGQKVYEVNGQRYQMDVAPCIKNGRTLLPLRFVGYAMGIAEKDVTWNGVLGEATLKRWYGDGQYNYDEITFRTKPGAIKQLGDYDLNGWSYTAKLDVPAEVVPPGRTMIPFRAVVHALGGLAFWDGKERCVTVVTWEKPPKPVAQTVKRVEATLEKNEAKVTYLSGTTKTVKTERPAVIDFVRPNGKPGYMVNAIEWFKLWGVPEEAMLFDPVRGGLIVRGAATHNNPLDGMDQQANTYVAFYAGEKQLWDGFFKRHPAKKEDLDKADPMYVKEGAFYGGCAVEDSPAYLFGGSGWYWEKKSVGEDWILIIGVEGSE